MKSLNSMFFLSTRLTFIFYALTCQTVAFAILEVTNGVTGGTLLLFPTTDHESDENAPDRLSAVYCLLGSPPNKNLNGCDGANKKIFTGMSRSQLRGVLLQFLPEAETKLIDSDHKFHVHSLNIWHTDQNFFEIEIKRSNLERLVDEINASLERLKSANIQNEQIKSSPLSMQLENVSNQLKAVNDAMLPIEPSRSAINHEIETILTQALSEEVHRLAALAPSSDVKQVWLSLLSERENLKLHRSYWTGFVLDLGILKNLRNKNYVIVAEPGSDKVSFLPCSPKNHPKGCLQVNELQQIRIEKEQFISSASQLGIAIEEMISQTNLENQYRVIPNQGDILKLLRIFNGAPDRDKDFVGVDLEQGKIWWRAYDTCSRLQADQLEIQNPNWKLPSVQQLRLSRSFLEQSGWRNREELEINQVWISDKPTVAVGKMDWPGSGKRNQRYWSIHDPVYIPWVLVSPYCKLDATYTLSNYYNDVNKSSVSYQEMSQKRTEVIKTIESSDWKKYSVIEAMAAAWLVTDY